MNMMNTTISNELSNISTQLQLMSTELHFTQAAINNLEQVLQAQHDQCATNHAEHTDASIQRLKHREADLQHAVIKLTTRQQELYKSMM